MDQTHAIRIWFGNSHHIRERDYLPRAFLIPYTLVRLYPAFRLPKYSYNDCANAPGLQGLGISDEHRR